MSHMDLCAGAQERGLQFADGYAEDGDDVLVTFGIVEAARDQVIKEQAEAAAKPTKRPRLKKSDTATGVQEVGDETAVIGESSRQRGKAEAPMEARFQTQEAKREVDACSRDYPGEQSHRENEAC